MDYHLALPEVGHALGLPHSSEERNLTTYDRYRTMICTRDDIRRGGWLTPEDVTALRLRYTGV